MYGLVCALIVIAASAASGFNLVESRDVIFHLYTRANPQLSQPLLPSLSSIFSSHYSPFRPTVLTIHGHNDSVGGNFNAFMIPSHLMDDVNVVAVDWSPGSAMYTEALANAPQCGRMIANFVNLLIREFSYDADNFRIVGHGIGGHIAGIAARHIDGDVPHIIALDPSLHGWTHHPEILNPDDAFMVEVIHTTAGDIGYDYPLGDLDFYPNGGSTQMGCTTTACSHTLAYVFYSESISADHSGANRFVGIRCDSYENAINLSCSGDRDATFGGIETKMFESGIYVFLTNFQSPFARG